MEIPKEIKGYCKKCKTHTTLELKVYKPKKGRTLAIGNRKNEEKHKSGYGGKAKHIKPVKKNNKKPVFVAKCKTCGHKQYFGIHKRMKKTEFKK